MHLGQSVRALGHHIASGSKHSSHQWTLMLDTEDHGAQTASGFDTVILALPAPQAVQLLQTAPQGMALAKSLSTVEMAPCWAMTLSYPMAAQAGLNTLGPQWNAARSTHERVAWVARESSKPGRAQTERWTVHANPLWSNEHRHDDPTRVLSKLQRPLARSPASAWLAPCQRLPLATCPDAFPLGQPFAYERAAGLGLRRLVHRQPRRGRVHLRAGDGAGLPEDAPRLGRLSAPLCAPLCVPCALSAPVW